MPPAPLTDSRAPRALLTGFGPFLDVRENPSGIIARALDGEQVGGVRIEGCQLPVSFIEAPHAIDALWARPDSFEFVLSMGVHRGPNLRIERIGRSLLHSDKADNDGLLGREVELDGGPPLQTSFDVDVIQSALAQTPFDVEVSTQAGGYVCERVCRHIYRRGAEWATPALFLHLPPLPEASHEESLLAVRTLLLELRRQSLERALGGPSPID